MILHIKVEARKEVVREGFREFKITQLNDIINYTINPVARIYHRIRKILGKEKIGNVNYCPSYLEYEAAIDVLKEQWERIQKFIN